MKLAFRISKFVDGKWKAVDVVRSLENFDTYIGDEFPCQTLVESYQLPENFEEALELFKPKVGEPAIDNTK